MSNPVPQSRARSPQSRAARAATLDRGRTAAFLELELRESFRARQVQGVGEQAATGDEYEEEEEEEEEDDLQSLDQGRLMCTSRRPLPSLTKETLDAVAAFLAEYIPPPPPVPPEFICTRCGQEMYHQCPECIDVPIIGGNVLCVTCDYQDRSFLYEEDEGGGRGWGTFVCPSCLPRWVERQELLEMRQTWWDLRTQGFVPQRAGGETLVVRPWWSVRSRGI